MQNAPSVVYPVGHSAFYRFVLLCLGATAAAVISLGWLASWINSPSNTSHATWACGMFVWVIWAVMAWASQRRAPSGSLHWSAQAVPADLGDLPGAWLWLYEDSVQAPAPVRIVPVLDLQSRLLLRVYGVPSEGHWLWFERTTNPPRWDDFRRALNAHAGRSQ